MIQYDFFHIYRNLIKAVLKEEWNQTVIVKTMGKMW